MIRPSSLSTPLRAAVLGCLVLLLATSGAAHAQAGTGHLEFFAGLYTPDADRIDDEITFGIRTGYQFNDSWGYLFQAGLYTTDDFDDTATLVDVGNFEYDLYVLDFSIAWYARAGNHEGFNVFFGPGYAFSSIESDRTGQFADLDFATEDGFTLHAGLGWNIMPSDQFSIRPDVRARYFDVHEGVDLEATIAFGWVFE